MRIINPKKSSGSNGVSVNESGDLLFTPKKSSPLIEKGVKAINRECLNGSLENGEKYADQSIEIDSQDVFVSEKGAKAIRSFNSKQDAIASNDESEEDISKKEFLRIYNKGIHLLSIREHSETEITNKLSLKTERLDLVSAVIDDLIEKKYLSNDRFTESYVRSRRQRGFGPTKIRSELSSKGIKNNMIDQYLDVGSGVWYENATNQYHKKYGDEPISDYNTWTKRARFMQSRGFTMEHIHATLPQVESD